MVSANADEDRLLPAEDYLPDPLNDRMMPNVKSPPHKPLSTKRAFAAGKMNSKLIRNWIKEGGTLSKSCLQSVLLWAKQLFQKEPSLVRIDGSVAVIGDIHG